MTTDSSTGDWTPERERAARERCETLRIAIEKMTTEEGEDPAEELYESARDLIHGETAEAHEEMIEGHRERVNALRAAFRDAREDLPAALAEIERLRDLLREADKAPAEKCARCDKPAGETAVRDGVDTLCMACSIDDLDGRDIDGESGSR